MLPFLLLSRGPGRRWLPMILAGVAATSALLRTVPAQTAGVTVVHSFAGPTNGVSPRATLLRGRDGNFYGTTQAGGPAELGSVFLLTPAGNLTTLHTFGAVATAANGNTSNPDGTGPSAALLQGRDGNLYGGTGGGGANGYGTVFSINAGGTLTTLHHFAFNDGASLNSALLQTADGKFYGVTEYGGTDGGGTVFAMSSAGTFTSLHSFAGNAEGMRPRGALVQGTDGNFYGTTSQGGPTIGGTAFRITPAGQLTVLHAFSQPPDGSYPLAGLTLGRDGNFYGTTARGGANDQGTVFMMTPDGTVTILYNFTGYLDGSSPNAALLQAGDGTLYGTTSNTAFKLTTDGQFTLLASLSGYNGGPDQSGAGLALGTDGNFYGALSYDQSASGGGSVYRVTPAGVLSTVHAFDRRGSYGDSPQGKLTQLADGSFYDTASRGGEARQGTVFALTPGGAYKVLHHFYSSEAGYVPQTGLVQASDGRLYGTTIYGNNNSGTVFSITPAGDLSTFYSFPYDGSTGAYPQAPLVLGRDKKLYGSAYSAGGSTNSGTIFALGSTGAVTNLHTFTGSFRGDSSDGAGPYGAMVQGTDGKFYGTTSSGGSAGQGTVFSVTPAGVYYTLHSFSGNFAGDPVTSGDGAAPYADLVQGVDGNFYGVTSQGGDYTLGTVFMVTPAGALTVLHSFGGTTNDGSYPGGGLVQDGSGNFYGTTSGGGLYGHGTAFTITPGGLLTTIYQFAGTDGASPSSALFRASDGNFYGTTYSGGLYNLGAVFRLTPAGATPAAPPAPDAQITAAHPASVTQGDNGDVFGLTVANVGNADTGGTVTVTVTPGQGLYLAALSGPGWTCVRDSGSGGGWTCTRADALGSGHYYPMLTVLVNVSPDASTAQGGTLTSRVAASGDTQTANNSVTDTFAIGAATSTPSQRWRFQYFNTTANSGSAADTANPVGDGINNLLKYALGLDPTVAGVSPVTVDTSTGYLRLTTPKNANATDVTFTVQVSGNVADSAGWTTNGTVVLQNTTTLLQVRDGALVRSGSRRFIRLQVSR